MIISKEIYLQRPLPSGNYPIVIRVSHLGKDKIIDTFVCCQRRHWDASHNTVSHHDAAHCMKNNHIDSLYRRIAGNIQAYLDKMLEENLESLLNNIYDGNDTRTHSVEKKRKVSSEPSQKSGFDSPNPSLSFSALIKEKISSISSLNTRRGYEGFLRYFSSNFDNNLSLENLNENFVDMFRKKLEENYPAQGSMRHLLSSRLNAVINFGKGKGVIPQNFSCKLPNYPLFPSERNLSEKELCKIFSLFKLKIREDPSLEESSTLSLALFILDIAFQGLAPTDLASLRIRDLSFSRVSTSNTRLLGGAASEDDIDVVSIKTLRKKTGFPVSIVAPIEPVKMILSALMRGKANDDYLLPCFNKDKTYSSEQRQNRLANFFYKLSVALNKVLEDSGYRILSGKITFYFARHAYCNLVDSMDVPRHLIQHLIGHRVTVLERSYLRRITPAEQAAISLRIFAMLDSKT